LILIGAPPVGTGYRSLKGIARDALFFRDTKL